MARPPLWLALHFPRLGLELAREFHEPSLPCVLIEARQQRRIIVAVDAAAAAAGLRVGQAQAQAQALVGQLQCLQRDPAAERRALEHLASCAYRYSPEVRLDGPAGLLLEISRSLRLYESDADTSCGRQPAGDSSCADHSHPEAKRRQVAALQKRPHAPQSGVRWPDSAFALPEPRALTRLLSRLHQNLQQLGFLPDAGLGRTPAAARLRAQLVGAGSMPSAFASLDKLSKTDDPPPPMPSLQPTPVEALPLPRKLRQALTGSGIATLATLRKLPRASLQRRFGTELPDLLDRLEGRKPEPGKPWQPPDHYQAEIELPAPTALGEALRFPLRRLLNDLCLALTARDATAEHLQLGLELELDRSEPMSAAVRHKAGLRKAPVGGRESGVGSAPQATTQSHGTRPASALLPPRSSRGQALGPGPWALSPALLTPQPPDRVEGRLSALSPAPHKPSALSPALKSPALLDLRLLQPSRDPRQLLELIEQRLEHVALPGRILSLRLNVPTLPPHRALQHDLFDPRAQSQHEWPRLIEGLRARLGDRRLLQAQALPDHRPEHAAALCELVDSDQQRSRGSAPGRRPSTSTQAAAIRDNAAATATKTVATSASLHTALQHDLQQAPLWLLPKPIRIDSGTVQPLAPRNRIEGGWWASKDIRRDYYRATDAHGGHCWIYQDLRAAQCEHLQGWFG